MNEFCVPLRVSGCRNVGPVVVLTVKTSLRGHVVALHFLCSGCGRCSIVVSENEHLSLLQAYPKKKKGMMGGEYKSRPDLQPLRDLEKAFEDDTLEKSGALTTSIKKVQSIYRETIFPEMKADWSVYPDNIGHRDSPGCFRCHNDELESADGETIFTTCNKCHLVLAQGESIEQVNVDLEKGLPFVHPEDFETIEEYTECTNCHTGGAEVYE